jgi:hypothetical protein
VSAGFSSPPCWPLRTRPPPPDSLDVQTILARRSAHLDSLLRPESLAPPDPALRRRIEELDAGGADALSTLGRHRPGLRASFVPGRFSTYNRVEGSRPGVGLDLGRGRALRLRADAGYAVEPHRWVGDAALEVGKPRRGPALRLRGGEGFRPFGPTPETTGAAILSLVAGQDRRDYLRRREAALELDLVRAPGMTLRLGAFTRDDRSAEAGAASHLFGGGTPIERPNPAIDRAVVRGASVAGSRSLRGDEVRLSAEAGYGAGDFDFAWQEGRVALRPILPDGGVLHIEIEGRNMAGSPPVQEEPFLGGDANLRGTDRIRYTGRRRASLRVEYELGVDLFRRSGVPLLRSAGLQFIPFLDAGTTWGRGRGVEGTRKSLAGMVKGSAGLGVRKDVWLPGVHALRLDVVRPTEGRGGWGAWFRLLPYAFD